jgi:CRISPR-associated protein (TIGR02584 family)
MHPIHVLATVGESPAVLTELLWWLCVHERRSLAGVEIWATGRGAERVLQLARSETWDALGRAIGPTLPAVRQPEAPEPPCAGVQLYTLARNGQPLDDVRTHAEANAVSAALHDRLRDLRQALPAHVPLVASLAGGRKTVSAALQTAFSMQSRRGDRLVHVVPHSAIEAHFGAFAFPSATWAETTGVPIDEQIAVYDVAVPRLRLLATPSVEEALDLHWDAVWSGLEANATRDVAATLEQTAASWRLTVRDAETSAILGVCAPSVREGAVLAALVALDAPTNAEILEWLDAHDAGWRPHMVPDTDGPANESGEQRLRRRTNVVSKAVQSLFQSLARDLPTGIAAWRRRDRRLPKTPLRWR